MIKQTNNHMTKYTDEKYLLTANKLKTNLSIAPSKIIPRQTAIGATQSSFLSVQQPEEISLQYLAVPHSSLK